MSHKNHYHLLMRTGYPIHFDYDKIPNEMEMIFMNGVFRHGSRFWSSKYSLDFNEIIKKEVLNTKNSRDNAPLINKYSNLIKKHGEKEVGNICNKGEVELKEIGIIISVEHTNLVDYFDIYKLKI